MSTDRLRALDEAVRRFADERDWGPFHTPKNLASALIVEAAELLEHFQWLTPEQSAALAPAARDEVAREMADVLIYLLRLAQVQGIDLLAAAEAKLADNARRYPVETARGSSAKSMVR
ncbi:MAG: nucleotide pyrophosphohydrolase [Rhodocyclaceae bacterium]|nr:nucleotide pyrophosphohydrolase [Rhodocyclaceae bacterium]